MEFCAGQAWDWITNGAELDLGTKQAMLNIPEIRMFALHESSMHYKRSMPCSPQWHIDTSVLELSELRE